jgi:hypothetical protein
MNTYPISTNNKYHDVQHINTILRNNNYTQYIHNRKKKHNKNTTHKSKWATFNYIRIETRIMTKLFKDTHKNSIQNKKYHTESPQIHKTTKKYM